MPTDCSKFRIPLMTYIKLQNADCSIDCCDTEIDALIGVETDIYQDDEFPNLYKATCLFYELVDVVQLGNPVMIDMYGLFHHNIDVIREWVKEAWKPEYVGLLDEDDGEWEYQLIESIGQLISGNVGEITAGRYVKLFEQFKRVPAKADEMVLVPARNTVDEDKLTLSKDILGLWEQTVCEIRGEIKAQDTPALVYAKELCDKLEHSMCASAGGPYSLNYSIGD